MCRARGWRFPGLTRIVGNLCSCPLTPVVSKASAGAMEVMDVFATPDLPGFLQVKWDERWKEEATSLARAHKATST